MRTQFIDDAFFRGKALLLVEDELTRRTLARCWNEHATAKQITLRSAGGRRSVEALVQAAREQGRRTVFGLVDLDFDLRTTPGDGPVFHTERHEFENHLLDFDALGRVSFSSSANVIGSIALTYARSANGWMALRRTLVALKAELPGFPADPGPHEVPDIEAAVTWLRRQKSPQDIESEVRRTWTKAYLEKRARQFDADYAHDLTSDRWLTTFSGKEILRHVRGAIHWRHPTVSDDDLAFQVADHWIRRGGVPKFVDSMRDNIIAKCGL